MKGEHKMYKYYRIKVKFNLKNEKVVSCIMNNFDYDKMDNDGVIEMVYKSNSAGSEESAIKGLKKYLNWYEAFKRNYQIIGIEEK